MPMSFPDMESLKNRATQRKFRQPFEGESEYDYRNALADYMIGVDKVESMEIRSGKGHDEMDPTYMALELLGMMNTPRQREGVYYQNAEGEFIPKYGN